MATANKFLEQPARGSETGVWDTPVNNNSGIIDNSFGGTTTLVLNNSNVVLSSAQYQNVFLNLTGTITANIIITLPAVGSFYTVQNRTGGNFTITLQTTVALSQVIACPPYEPFDILTDGSNVKFRNLGRVGTYEQYAGTAVPGWITACSVPPFLECTGATFSSATYPALRDILGTTTLPDHRGRAFFAYNDGTSRITTASGGLDGDTLFSGGGSATITQLTSQIAAHTHGTSDAGHTHINTFNAIASLFTGGAGAGRFGSTVAGSTALYTVVTSCAATTGLTVLSEGESTPMNSVPPGLVGGIVMIRAA